MRISAIKPQVKNTERVSVYVDGIYAFSLSLDELVEHRLKSGLVLDEAQLKAFKKLSQEGKWRARSLDWLLRRPHSTKEFRDYLYRKKIEPDFMNSLVKEFQTKKYLNDEAFARFWVESRRSSKHASSRRLRFELRQKGVQKEIVDMILQDTEVDELQALTELITSKRRQTRYQDQQKLTAYLLRQGYNYENIKQALES